MVDAGGAGNLTPVGGLVGKFPLCQDSTAAQHGRHPQKSWVFARYLNGCAAPKQPRSVDRPQDDCRRIGRRQDDLAVTTPAVR